MSAPELRRGLTRCTKCEKIVSKTRRHPHEGTPDCIVRCAIDRMAVRGWVFVHATHASMLEECGVPVERAPRSVDIGIWSGKVGEPNAEKVIDGTYAPAAAARAVHSLRGVTIAAHHRRVVLGMLLADPDLVAALDAVRRLDGDVHAYCRGLAREAMRGGIEEDARP